MLRTESTSAHVPPRSAETSGPGRGAAVTAGGSPANGMVNHSTSPLVLRRTSHSGAWPVTTGSADGSSSSHQSPSPFANRAVSGPAVTGPGRARGIAVDLDRQLCVLHGLDVYAHAR